MKKILQIILIALIPIALIVGGLYLMGNIKKDSIIKDAIRSIDNPYYQELAKQCGQKDKSLYKCCLASVYDMIEVQGQLMTEPVCANLISEQLKCPGSFEWCIPLAGVTMPEGTELDNENDHTACEIDADCVPDKCCHASNVVNKQFAPECSEINCTMSCDTVLDCGQSKPICKNNTCDISQE